MAENQRSTTVKLRVTAGDDTSTTYTVVVSRVSTDATLRDLTLSGIPFTFDPARADYSVNVANTVTETTVVATPSDDHAMDPVIKLGGVVDEDGTIPLAVGGNVITIEVTAEDGVSTQTYTVLVTRRADPSLSALTFSGTGFTFVNVPGEAAQDILVPAAPATESTTFSAVPVADAMISNTLADDDPNTPGHQLNLRDLRTRDLTIEVHAGAGITAAAKTYRIKIRRQQSMDAALRGLTLANAADSANIDFGAFSSQTVSYDVTVGHGVEQVTVTYEQGHFASQPSFVSPDADPILEGHQVDLDVGDNQSRSRS